MSKPFLTEKRLFAAIHSYILLLQPLTSIRAYSGAKRLYLMTGLGVTLASAGDLARLKENLAKDDTLLDPPLCYVQDAIAANCATYAKMLGEIILRRLDTRGTQDVPHDGGSHPRLSYNISAPLGMQIDRLTDASQYTRQIWGQATLFQNLADMTQVEYAHVANMGGKLLAHPRRDETIRALVGRLSEFFTDCDATACEPRSFHLPILTTLLCIARLLHADFNETFSVPPIGPLCHRLWISDSTLAALPWPSPDFVKGFHENDAGLISSAGWRYLNHISAVYPDRFSNAA